MSPMKKELGRLSATLIVRGAAMAALGTAALVWPEEVLILAMLSVGVVATLLGIYEISLAFGIRDRTRRWSLVLIHGIASVAFGLLTVGSPGVSLRVALAIIAVWLVLYASVAWASATLVWPLPMVRWTLLILGVVDVVLAVLVVLAPAATIFALLFLGAAYAAGFGLWQVAAGVWLRHTLHAYDATFQDSRFAGAH